MSCTKWLALVAAIVVVSSASAATSKGHLVEFHPISRKQYDSILGLTNGKPVISEARLISSGLKSLSELRSTISQDISSGWHQLLNITGLWPISNKPSDEKVSGYPLCVIKTTDLVPVDEGDDHGHEHGDHHGRGRSDDYRDITQIPAMVFKSHMSQPPAQGHGHEYEHDHDHDHYQPQEPDNGNGSEYDKDRPVINCIVVVKPKTPPPTQEPENPHHSYPPQPPAHPSYYPPYPQYPTAAYPYPYPYHYPYQPAVYRASPQANTARKTPSRRRYKYRGVQPVHRSSPDTSDEEDDNEPTNESKAIDYSQLYYQQILNNLYQPHLSQQRPLPYGSPLAYNPYMQQPTSNPSFALYNGLQAYGGNARTPTGTPYSSSHGNSAYAAGNNNIYANLLALQQWQQLQRLQQNNRPHHSPSSNSNEDETYSGEEER